MSFSSATKEELAKIALHTEDARRAELAAIGRLAGTIELMAGGKMLLRIDTESSVIAWRVFELIRQLYRYGCEVRMKEGQRLYKHSSYQVRVEDAAVAHTLLQDMGILISDQDVEGMQPAWELLKDESCINAFLRGAFLASGSVSDPQRGYHMEIVVRDEELAKLLERVMSEQGLHAHLIERKDVNVVYLKDSEHIVELLGRMGAVRSLLDFENVRVERSVRNQFNRAINCETANLDKTMSAAAKQCEAIQYLEKKQKFQLMPPELREVAELRMEYPQETLAELAARLPGVSKSGVNHRLRRIVELAQEQKEKDER